MIFFFCFIFGIGLLFWSLSTVLIDRWHSGKWGILMGRSECPKCRHRLAPRELVPLFSYLFQRGKCHHCHTHISLFYPLSELLTGSIFVIITIAYFQNNFWEIPSFTFFLLLFLWFITAVYSLYDLRYLEIPDKIMIPGIYGYLMLLFASHFFPSMEYIFFDRLTYIGSIDSLIKDHLTWAWILYTFLYMQILIPGGWYLASRGRFKDVFELIFSYILFPFTLLIESIYKKKASLSKDEEIPTWVGGGDLRIALFIGLTLWELHGIASFAIAYIVWSIIGIVLLLLWVMKKSKNSQIPFWPFLAIGWICAIVFHGEILDFITSSFLW